MSKKRVHTWVDPSFKKLIDESGMTSTKFTKRVADSLLTEEEQLVKMKSNKLRFKL